MIGPLKEFGAISSQCKQAVKEITKRIKTHKNVKRRNRATNLQLTRLHKHIKTAPVSL